MGPKKFAEPRAKKSPLGKTGKAADLVGSPKKLTAVEKEEQLKINEERLAAYGFTHLGKGNGVSKSLDGGMTSFGPGNTRAGVPQPV